jgi:phage terminase large subunit GpA-like protein
LAIKGKEGDRPAIATPSNQDVNWRGKKVKRGIQLYILGVDKIKQTLLSRAQLDRPGPKYLNVPVNVSADWCEQFAGSEIMVKKHKGSGYTYVWEPVSNVRNEGLDCAVYAYAAALHVGLERINWEKLRRSLTVADDPPAIAESKPTPEPTTEAPPKSARPRRQRPHRNSFIHGR